MKENIDGTARICKEGDGKRKMERGEKREKREMERNLLRARADRIPHRHTSHILVLRARLSRVTIPTAPSSFTGHRKRAIDPRLDYFIMPDAFLDDQCRKLVYSTFHTGNTLQQPIFCGRCDGKLRFKLRIHEDEVCISFASFFVPLVKPNVVVVCLIAVDLQLSVCLFDRLELTSESSNSIIGPSECVKNSNDVQHQEVYLRSLKAGVIDGFADTADITP